MLMSERPDEVLDAIRQFSQDMAGDRVYPRSRQV
jgi:hypothetical protein